MDTVPNEDHLEWTLSQMDMISNGRNLEWTGTILNGLDPEWTRS